MSGVKGNWSYPVLTHEGALAISDEEKADMMVNVLAKVHSNENLTEEDKKERNKTCTQNQSSSESNIEQEGSINATFSLNELKRAINKAKITTRGKDKIRLKHLNDSSLRVILELYNKIWRAGKTPNSWKLAVVVPIRKPGKDSAIAANYRPIALTSHPGKIMERMIVERLSYYVESHNLIAIY